MGAVLLASCQTSTISSSTMKTATVKDVRLDYPTPPRSEVVDDYHGTRVADPFRTLESASNPATIAWMDAENALTASYLDRPEREVIKRRLGELFQYTRVSIPKRSANRYVFSKSEGLQNQPIYYVQDGTGTPRVLIDPNTLSTDGTVSLMEYSLSDDGALLAYSVSRGGSDRREVRVRDVGTGRDLADKLEWVKFSGLDWTPDNKGFFYNRYPPTGSVPAGEEHYFPKVQYHQIGSSQESDRVVYERPKEREVGFSTLVSDDGRWIVITASNGSADESEIWVDDLRNGDGFRPLYTGFKYAYVASKVVAGRLYLLTNESAPSRRVIAIDLAQGTLEEIIPAAGDYLEEIEIINRKIVARYLHNASSLIKIYELDGRFVKELPLPGIGTVSDIEGTTNNPEMFLSYNSYIDAPTNYRYDFTTGELSAFNRSDAPIDSSRYETEQVWFPSKDGTRVSMFLSRRKGVAKGPTPVFLYGYGGFNNAYTPAFNPVHFYFMERGGTFAVVNLRGGSEYGEEWHRAGMLEKKQNVFDDFYAAAEWLIANGYTLKSKLAVSGRSNGGLLAAAAVAQRPDLMRAAVVQVPVVDMLRYHLFTVARFWIPEYGSSENAEQFKFLYAYSPLHNLRDGVSYPATLITTADTDDRVDPGPAKKFAARLQEAQGGPAPILIRIEKKAGHSSGSLGSGGKPISKLIDEWADIWTFVTGELGM